MNEIKAKALDAALAIHRVAGYGDATAVIVMAREIEDYLLGRDERSAPSASDSQEAPTAGMIQ